MSSFEKPLGLSYIEYPNSIEITAKTFEPFQLVSDFKDKYFIEKFIAKKTFKSFRKSFSHWGHVHQKHLKLNCVLELPF